MDALCVFLLIYLEFVKSTEQIMIAVMSDVSDGCIPGYEFSQIFPNGSRKCQPCSIAPPGHQIKRHCTYYTDTIFEVCPPETYSQGGQDECQKCSSCDRGHGVSTICNGHNDTECVRCRSGTFANENGICEPCRDCSPGEFVSRRCKPSRNTVCKPCPDRYYSDRPNAARCSVCNFCSRFVTVVKSCNRSSDVICGDCKKGYFKDSAMGQCLKCSFCYPNETVVVEACTKQESDGIDSQYVCVPVVGHRSWDSDTETYSEVSIENLTGKKKSTSDIKDTTDVILAAFILIVSFATFFLVILCIIISSPQIQFCLRLMKERSLYIFINSLCKDSEDAREIPERVVGPVSFVSQIHSTDNDLDLVDGVDQIPDLPSHCYTIPKMDLVQENGGSRALFVQSISLPDSQQQNDRGLKDCLNNRCGSPAVESSGCVKPYGNPNPYSQEYGSGDSSNTNDTDEINRYRSWSDAQEKRTRTNRKKRKRRANTHKEHHEQLMSNAKYCASTW